MVKTGKRIGTTSKLSNLHSTLITRNFSTSTNPALVQGPSNSRREELETQRDQSHQEKVNSEREMDSKLEEFTASFATVLDQNETRAEGLSERHEQEYAAANRSSLLFHNDLARQQDDIHEGNNDIFVQLRQAEINREKVHISAGLSKSQKSFLDEHSTIDGNALEEDYDSSLAEIERAEKAVLESIDKHIDNVQKVIEIEEQIRSLGNGDDNGSAPANDTGSGTNNGPAANTGSLLDDFADPNLEQPSHMDSDD